MMASVSRAERDSRERVRLRARRTSQGATSGRVTSRYPPPTSMIMRARSSASSLALSLVTSARASSGEPSSSTSRMRSGSTGVSEAKRRASTTSMGSVIRGVSTSRFSARGGGGRVCGWSFDHDLAHALEDGQRIRLDLARRPALLLLDESRDGALEEMHREIFERDVLGRRQLGHRASIEQRLLRLALAEPGPQGLDPRVLAQALGQLLAQELALLVELIRGRVRIGGQEELRLEIDERRRHHHEGPRRLEILELHGLEVREVLLGDGADGQVGEVDLVGPAEVKEKIEGADERLDPDGQALRFGSGFSLDHLVTGAQKWPPYSPTRVFLGRRGAQKWPSYSPSCVFIA